MSRLSDQCIEVEQRFGELLEEMTNEQTGSKSPDNQQINQDRSPSQLDDIQNLIINQETPNNDTLGNPE